MKIEFKNWVSIDGKIFIDGKELSNTEMVSVIINLLSELKAAKERLNVCRKSAKDSHELMQEVERLAYKAINGNTIRKGDESGGMG